MWWGGRTIQARSSLTTTLNRGSRLAARPRFGVCSACLRGGPVGGVRRNNTGSHAAAALARMFFSILPAASASNDCTAVRSRPQGASASFSSGGVGAPLPQQTNAECEIVAGIHAMAARRRAAVHEASHACACHVLGLPILEISIVDGAYLHRGHYAPGHPRYRMFGDHVFGWLRGRATVLRR